MSTKQETDPLPVLQEHEARASTSPCLVHVGAGQHLVHDPERPDRLDAELGTGFFREEDLQ